MSVPQAFSACRLRPIQGQSKGAQWQSKGAQGQSKGAQGQSKGAQGKVCRTCSTQQARLSFFITATPSETLKVGFGNLHLR